MNSEIVESSLDPIFDFKDDDTVEDFFPLKFLRNRDYAAIERILEDSSDKNMCVGEAKSVTEMTGLEYSIFQSDWKMFLVFLLRGTDPDANKFEGVIDVGGPPYGVPPTVYECFRSKTTGELEYVPGFKGLYLFLNCLADDNSIETHDYATMSRVLWLAECSRKRSRLAVESIPEIQSACLWLKPDFDWNERFTHRLIQSLWAVQHLSNAFPEVILDQIKTHLVSFQLESTILSLFECVVEEAKSQIQIPPSISIPTSSSLPG